MKILHAKSSCCLANVSRFGGRRRQCVSCHKTWRIRVKKRGRKRRRMNPLHLRKVLAEKMLIKHLVRKGTNYQALKKRFANSLKQLQVKKREIIINGEQLIAVVDAEIQCFNKQLWTLYLVAIRSTDSEVATVLDPRLLPGHESANDWGRVLDQLPVDIKNRLISVVSDGIRGLKSIVEERGWTIQRCHFHLLLAIQKSIGKRLTTTGRKTRKEIYQLVQELLINRNDQRVVILTKRLCQMAQRADCPRRLRYIVNGFCRELYDFRLYLKETLWNLPNTTNTIESSNSKIRFKTQKLNTPQAWHRWALAVIRLHPNFVCKRAKYQPN